MTRLARNRRDIWVVDAEATWMTQHFLHTFPERWVETGIAEQNMVGVAAGIASTGKIVFVNTMANFLTLRAIEQIKVDVIYNHFNVKLASSFGGVLGGPWGPTHHGLEDIALCRSLPFMRVVVPATAYEVREAVRCAAKDESPIYIRLEREEDVNHDERKFRLGRANLLREGKDVTVIACGSMVGSSIQAAAILAKRRIDVGVINMHTVKPIDAEAVLKAGRATGAIVTVEEHQITGGLGSAVAEVIAEKATSPIRLERIGFEDTLVEIVGNYKQILKHYRLTPKDIAEKIAKFLGSIKTNQN